MIDKERSRREFLEVFTKNIEESQQLFDRLDGGELVLVNHDCTLLLVQNATEVRFGHMTSKESLQFSGSGGYIDAGAAATRWNSRLSDEQRRAGCIVRPMFYCDALREYIKVQHNLITLMETVK